MRRDAEFRATNSLVSSRTALVLLAGAVGLLALGGCRGWLSIDQNKPGGASSEDSPTAGSGGGASSGGSQDAGPHDRNGQRMDRRLPAAVGGLKRLTRLEYDNSLHELFGPPNKGDWTFGESFVPGVSPKPFSNDMFRQKPSSSLIRGLKRAAEKASAKVAEQLQNSSAMRKYVLGCQPKGPNDEKCFRTFVRQFGRRAFRHPLDKSEVDEFTKRYFELQKIRQEAKAANNSELRKAAANATFNEKVKLAIEGILQHPEFVYRTETGPKVPERSSGDVTIRKLDDYSMASRLAYFLWGQPPDGELLRAAAEGRLETASQVRTQAARMLKKRAARERMYHFHAGWLNFQSFWLGRNNQTIPDDQADAMRKETRKLLRRVLFEKKSSWLELFRADRTWVEPELADYYEFVDPEDFDGDKGKWVKYPDESLRRGILSHGTFLTNGRRASGGTHIIRRSEVILHRLMCESIGAPPDNAPSNVEDAKGAKNADCKVDKLDAATLRGSCATCHYKLNKLGGALENFDNKGRYRQYRSSDQNCRIEGDGGIYRRKKNKGWTEVRDFQGPKGLTNTLLEQEELAGCMVKHLYEFALGHPVRTSAGKTAVKRLRKYFQESNYRFDKLVLALAGSDAFRYRRIDTSESPSSGD